MSGREVPPETLAQWRRDWQLVGTARIAELVACQSLDLLVYDPAMRAGVKRREAELWLEEQSAELARQVEQAKADRRWARWHSWINTAIAVGGFVLAIIALWRGW